MAISIITAIHNALPMNQLFWKALSQNTETPFELVLVDNHSTDGSQNFFRELSESRLRAGQEVTYLRNETNRTYPASQNQGRRAAKHDILVFMNNDVWVPKGWEKAIVAALEENPYLVVSPSGQEAQPRQSLSDNLKSRWKRASLLAHAWRVFTRADEEAAVEEGKNW